MLLTVPVRYGQPVILFLLIHDLLFLLISTRQLVIVSFTTSAIAWFDSWYCCIASHAIQQSCTSDVEYSDVSSRLWTLSSTGRSTTPSQRSSSRADIVGFITVEARAFVALGHEAH